MVASAIQQDNALQSGINRALDRLLPRGQAGGGELFEMLGREFHAGGCDRVFDLVERFDDDDRGYRSNFDSAAVIHAAILWQATRLMVDLALLDSSYKS